MDRVGDLSASIDALEAKLADSQREAQAARAEVEEARARGVKEGTEAAARERDAALRREAEVGRSSLTLKPRTVVAFQGRACL